MESFMNRKKYLHILFKCFLILNFLILDATLFAQLNEIEDFGSNPGALRCYYYIPQSAPKSNIPLLIVLHGCGQTAYEVSNQSGWNKLADSIGMIVVYPQQHLLNNPSRCYNWFKEEDIVRGHGEVESLHQMLTYFKTHYEVDDRRVFVFGMSAGATMGTILMAAYPEEITAGCSLAGPAIGTWEGSLSQMKSLYESEEYIPKSFLDKLRKCYPGYKGPYPLLISVHGGIDILVTVEDQMDQISQWTAASGSDAIPEKREVIFENPRVTRSSYSNVDGKTVVVAYQIDGVGHILPINVGDRLDEGGKTGLFTKDIGFHLPFWIAREFGLIN